MNVTKLIKEVSKVIHLNVPDEEFYPKSLGLEDQVPWILFESDNGRYVKVNIDSEYLEQF